MRRQSNKGQALPFTLIAVLALVIGGIGIAFLMQIFSGAHENRNACDTGILNVSKKAIANPTVSFDSKSEFQLMYKNCTLSDKGVDLSNYNRMVGSAMLIAMNASADGESTGLKNASKIIDELQGSDQSIGGKLKAAFEKPEDSGDWAKKHFDEVAHSNSTKMLGDEPQLSWTKEEYKTAYLESADGDVAASNVPINKLIDNMPHTYDESGLAEKRMETPKNLVATDGSDKFLQGYKPIQFPGVDRPLYAVPTQPKHQPHLVSMVTFDAANQKEAPGKAHKAVLPPNAFRGGSDVLDPRTNSKHRSTSAGIVGMPADPTPFEARLPQGFLVIDNSLTSDYTAALPNSDTWEACEAGTGTLVHRASGVFSTGGTVNGQPTNPLDNWLQTPRPDGFDAEKSGPPIKDDDGTALLYDRDGNPITSKQQAADQIPYDTNPNSVVLATDRNSDPAGANPDPVCVQHATPTLPDNLSPFNRAYHPNANASGSSASGRHLIAAEQAKLEILDLYGPSWVKGAVRSFNKNFGRTGLRLYPNGQNPVLGGPYIYAPEGIKLPFAAVGTGHRVSYGDPAVLGKVTTDGNLEELFNQTTGTPDKIPYVRIDGNSESGHLVKQAEKVTPIEEVKKFLLQRMREIKPTASDSELDKVVKQNLPLGNRYFVYLERPSDPNSNFVISVNAPTWARSLAADGKRHSFTAAYEISPYMVNAPNDFGIHDHLFMTNNVSAIAVDSVSYQSSSGANGLLGTVKFFQWVKGSNTSTMK